MGMLKRFKFKFAAWHLGVLIVALFLVAVVRHHRQEIVDPESAKKNMISIIDRTFFDWRMTARGTRAMSGKVGILAVDEKSIAKFGRWPFPRSSYAEAFKNLKAAGVKWIGLDVFFSEPESLLLTDALEPMEKILQTSLSPVGVLDPRRFAQGIEELLTTTPGDLSLAQAFKDFGNVVQAVAILSPQEGGELERDWSEAKNILSASVAPMVVSNGSFPAIQDDQFYPLINTKTIMGENPIYAFINNSPDSDGLMRVAQLVEEIPVGSKENPTQDKRFLPSMSLQLAAKYLNRQIEVRHNDAVTGIALVGADGTKIEVPLTRGDAKLLLNHYGEFTDLKGRETPVKLSLADAAENKFPADIPEVLILGSTTLGIDDRRPSPLNPTANGVEHHVAAVENIIRRDFLVHPDKFIVIELFLLLASGLLLCFFLSQSSALTSLFFLIFLHIGMEIIDQKFIFGRGRIINLGLFHFQNAIIFTTMILFKFLVEEREKRKIKGAFQHYLNPSVINQLLDNSDSLKLGGEKRELTVFFSDVRGFTTISERLAPESLANLLNEYFTPMTNIVLNSGGLLDKYIGDALMAVWGAPLPMDNHADNALHSSLKMLDALDVLREGWQKRNLPAIDIGCGINTGPMVIGNMGSELRFDYTVLGDAVNLGARLEGITKEYGVRVVCSEMTRAALKRPEDFVLRELDWIKVKGKNKPVTIFEVMRFTQGNREIAEKTAELFSTGLNQYRQREFAAAQMTMMTILQKTPQDGPAGIFLERCDYFMAHPPSEEWDGVWVMKSK